MNVADREILEKIERLSPRQKAEVVNFIDFVDERGAAEDTVVRFLLSRAEPGVDLSEIRRRLAKAPGKMSDTVRALRDERG